MPLDEKRTISAFYKVISRSPACRDLSLEEKLGLAGKLWERLEYLVEDEDLEISIGTPEDAVRDRGDEPIQRGPKPRRVEPISRQSGPPPLDEKHRLIIPAGDKEFEEAKRQYEEEQRGPARPGFRVTKLNSPAAGGGDVQYWTMESLIAYLQENFPPKISFTPDGVPEGTRVVAVRNIIAVPNAYPPNGVKILYAHEGINQSAIDPTEAGGGGISKINIAPIAMHLFLCNEQTIDVEGVLQKLADQLCGLYKARGKHTEPGWIPDPPIDSWSDKADGMRESDGSKWNKEWSPVADPQADVLRGIVHINRSQGTPGATR